jgi:hypothetical protein
MSWLMDARFGDEETFSPEEWISILKLSAMWEFDEIRKISADNIVDLPMDVVEKIVIARDYYVTKWFIPSLNEYARLDRSISAEDVDRLGLKYLLGIVKARQTVLKRSTNCIVDAEAPCCHSLKRFYTTIKFMWETGQTDSLRYVFRNEMKEVQKMWSTDRISIDPPVYVTTETKGVGKVRGISGTKGTRKSSRRKSTTQAATSRP